MDKIKKKIFAEGMCFKKIIYVFVIGSFLGVVIEMTYYFLKHGIIESRAGLLYGPFNVVYGVGVLILTLSLYKLKDWKKIFVSAAILGGFTEYICSLFQEKVFETISWNYINDFLNFNGRTDLFHILSWGLLGLFYIKIIWPYMNKIIEKIPVFFGNIFLVILILFFSFNIFISSACAFRHYERQNNISAKNNFDKFLDKNYDDDYLKKIYTNTRKPNKK